MYGQKSVKLTSLIFPGSFGDVDGSRYPNSTTPQISFPLTNSSLHSAQTSGSIIVSALVNAKSGRENETIWSLMLISTDIRVRIFTCSFSVMIRFLMFVHSSLFGKNVWTNSIISSISNCPSESSNFFNTQSRKKEGSFKSEKKLLCLRSLNTAISSKHSTNFSSNSVKRTPPYNISFDLKPSFSTLNSSPVAIIVPPAYTSAVYVFALVRFDISIEKE